MSFRNTPRMVTERLILRRFTENDLDAFFSIYADKSINTYLPWFPVENMEEARDFLEERYLKPYLEPQGYHYAICLRQDDVPVGYVDVCMDDGHDLGYGLRKELWHKGIVTEACRAVIAQLKRDHVPYVTATHDVNNVRSGNVMKRLGMTYRYSYEEQWQPKNRLVTFRMYQLSLNGENQKTFMKYWKVSTVHFVETLQ